MKHAFALLVLLTSGACHTPPPTVDMPRPYERNGVRVVVKELFGPDEHVIGIAGEAVNVGKVVLKTCSLHFDVLDFAELTIGDAEASREDVAPGEHWLFQAPFSTPFSDERWCSSPMPPIRSVRASRKS